MYMKWWLLGELLDIWDILWIVMKEAVYEGKNLKMYLLYDDKNLSLVYQTEGKYDSINQIQSTLKIINIFKCWCFVLYSVATNLV